MPLTKMMQPLVAAALVATLAVVACSPGRDVEELRRLTEQRFAANAANDRGFYQRLLADNAVVLIPHVPPKTKAEYLEFEFGSRQGSPQASKATIADFRALVDGSTAVVSYRAIEPTPLGDQQFESRSVRIDTYTRATGNWRLLSMAVGETPSWPDVAAIDPRLYADYVGTYEISPTVTVVVTNESGRLMAQVSGQPKSELFPENDTTFFDRTDSPLARTVFEHDSVGKVVAQVYRAQGQKIRARKIS